VELCHEQVALHGGGVMLILPPTYQPKILPWVPQREWREPSLFVPRDQFNNPVVQTKFRLRGRLHDGHVKFVLLFDSRDDFDQFLWSLGRQLTGIAPIPREDWRLPNHIWGDPALYPELQYDFATVTFLTGTNAANQSWAVPSDWNNANNLVSVIASGASGGARTGASSGSTTTSRASGGGGGGCSQQANITLTPGGTATYRLPAGGTGVSPASGQIAQGNNGADAWFNGADLASASAGAKGGSSGVAGSTAASTSGGAGGDAASGVGSNKRSGGRGGNLTSASAGARASGGGGAGGQDGDGSNGVDSESAATTTAGGDGGPTGGGTGSAGGNDGSSTSDGGAGTNFQLSPSRGAGAGSGGARSTSTTSVSSGDAGNYGAGSGGAATRNTSGGAGAASTGNGGQALIVIEYTPGVGNTSNFFSMF
jgi:hypothetical protein